MVGQWRQRNRDQISLHRCLFPNWQRLEGRLPRKLITLELPDIKRRKTHLSDRPRLKVWAKRFWMTERELSVVVEPDFAAFVLHRIPTAASSYIELSNGYFHNTWYVRNFHVFFCESVAFASPFVQTMTVRVITFRTFQKCLAIPRSPV